jgi:hypothetical protein
VGIGMMRRLLEITLAVLFFPGAARPMVTQEIGRSGNVPAFQHANARQIGQNREGIWFVVYDGQTDQGSGVFLAASKSPRPELAGDFQSAILIAGASPRRIIGSTPGSARHASFVIDHNDILHLVWATSEPQRVWYSQCRVGGKDAWSAISKTSNWTQADGKAVGAEPIQAAGNSQLGDIALAPNGDVIIIYARSVPAPTTGHYYFEDEGQQYAYLIGNKPVSEIWLTKVSNSRWVHRRLTSPGPFQSPVMDVDSAGNLHAVFSPGVWFLFYLRLPAVSSDFKEGSENTLSLPRPQVVWVGSQYVDYSVVGWDTKALVLFEKAGRVLMYAYLDGRQWHRQVFQPGTKEAFHEPILTRDNHDVGWAFWSNMTRSHTFYSRWMGAEFGAAYECRTLLGRGPASLEGGGESNLYFYQTVQKPMGPTQHNLGMAIASGDAPGEVYFDRLLVPSLEPEHNRKVLFIDMLEVSRMEGLVETLHAMRKHPANPVLRPGPDGAWDDLRAHLYGDVLYDGQKFRMWYTGENRHQNLDPEGVIRHVGYAESTDGINWVKPTLNQVDFNGSKANNIVDVDYSEQKSGGAKFAAYMPLVIKDSRETEPSRRYKMIVEQERGNTLHFSADGIHWSDAGTINPRLIPGTQEHNPEYFGDRRNLIDDWMETDPQRRWKIYGHCDIGKNMRDFLRKTCLYWSPDLFHWSADPDNPIMHPRAGAEVEQHLTSVWPTHAAIYVGMFDVWDAAQLMQQQLISSRDGRHFVHVFDGKPVLEMGKPGEWDGAWISPGNVPIEVNNELWYYYAGGPAPIGPQKAWFSALMQTGLATIRRDGFVSLDVQQGKREGYFETLPWTATASPIQLELNADGLRDGAGTIEVELVENDKVLAVSEKVVSDGVQIPVLWQDGATPQTLASGSARLRFRLSGSAHIYSFAFR